MASTSALKTKLSQQDIYRLLQQRGSAFLKQHVLFADRQVVILNKPPGIVSQLGASARGQKRESSTPLDPIFSHIRRWIPNSDPHPVHRLDKATTGTFLIALNSNVAKAMSSQFQQGTVSKTYLALVRGGPQSFSNKSGIIDVPLIYRDGRGDIGRKGKDGKEALTEWELVSSSSKAPLSLLRLQLHTGGKHQLRIHLAKVLKAPILGDTLHSQSSVHSSISALTQVPENRLFLHASEISFFKYHERGKRYRLGVRAPLAGDFRRICREAGIVIPPEERGAALLINDQIASEQDTELRLWDPNTLESRPLAP
ncbi:hypothetical protein CVT26_011283 [Gymnopilus dilepis]|uniref:21S rRNA pseudouridine(2819) synthase n=1 Tax=Gymnopilus dilepis TaxID=231916 RepID=A0A409VJG6_9AGAR|nr:hypothetical protein CVT26_011283 [Gymnopilus dilepis]